MATARGKTRNSLDDGEARDRVMFDDPPITKRQVVDFYGDIAEFVLPGCAIFAASVFLPEDSTSTTI